ncbi:MULTISPECIES: DUF2058 family protein [Desulfobacula]|uniref:Conserved uncharacterized protein n=2 Tax=Desulfobacula TaxID=28222 RepID=K0NL91_DESTT|nr:MULTISPECIES: DUF2058 family protein [Desulfobacula]CCK79467.1 conserved uncharacterized protein [Desulfobacula toluolica Tol2]SDT84378.1 hypothetical protein SAMN04487931_101220 [Desulfobacula phenolica]
MGKSFQDQLLKAGLVNKKQVKKVKHEKHVGRKKNKAKGSPTEINKARQEQLAKEKLSQELNRQLNKKKQERENLAQVRQLIETNRLNLDDYDESYYFTVGKKIKRLFVNEKISQKLCHGQLAIVKFDDCFEIVPAKVAEQITSRNHGDMVVLYNDHDESSC